MYFKVEKGCKLYEKLVLLQKSCDKAFKAAQKFAKQIGAEAAYSRHSLIHSGGVDAFKFSSDKIPDKELWMQPDRHNNPKLFYPRSGKGKKYRANDELHAKIKALPVVTFDEFNKTIEFESQFTGSLVHVRSFGLSIYPKYCLIKIHEGCKYKPLADMQEITETEFRKLDTHKEFV